MPHSPEVDLFLDLVAIPGRSGQEGAVMELIRDRLLAAGASESWLKFDTAHRKIPHGGEIGNLVLKLPGNVKGPRRMLSAHVDTVPICEGCMPKVVGSKVVNTSKNTGLGGDDRAGATVLLATADWLLREQPNYPPVTLLWTVQEEVGLYGARFANLSLLGKPKLAFNFDGSSPAKVVIGATGGYRMTIDIEGIASHAGNHPEEGVSAITISSIAIADLVENGWHGLVEKGRKQGTSNVGVIQGGAATNVVTPQVRLRAEARSHDSKFRERIVREMEAACERAARQVKNTDGEQGKVVFDGHLDYDSFRLPKDDPSVGVARQAVRAEGFEPELFIANGGLDANWLHARGIPAVTLGCGQHDIHTTSEWLDIEEFQTACRIARRLVAAGDSAVSSIPRRTA
jgi:tripeptide aminopeptidase